MLFVSIIGTGVPAGRPLYPWPVGYRGGGGRTLEAVRRQPLCFVCPSPWRKPAPGSRHLPFISSSLQHGGRAGGGFEHSSARRGGQMALGVVETGPRPLRSNSSRKRETSGLNRYAVSLMMRTTPKDAKYHWDSSRDRQGPLDNKRRDIDRAGLGQGPRARRQGSHPGQNPGINGTAGSCGVALCCWGICSSCILAVAALQISAGWTNSIQTGVVCMSRHSSMKDTNWTRWRWRVSPKCLLDRRWCRAPGMHPRPALPGSDAACASTLEPSGVQRPPIRSRVRTAALHEYILISEIIWIFLAHLETGCLAVCAGTKPTTLL
jgi:hypothetical protein